MKQFTLGVVFVMTFMSSVLPATHYIVLLGPPGAGKGTQVSLLKSEFGCASFSMGNILREQKLRGSEFAQIYAQAKADRETLMYLKFGIMIKTIAETSSSSNLIILDSWPKSPTSLQLADHSLFQNSTVTVIELVGTKEILLERAVKRVVCINQKCGKSYGLVMPREDGICDDCGDAIIKRSADNTVDFLGRLDKYFPFEQLELRQAYQDAGYFIYRVDATRPVEIVHQEIMNIIKNTSQHSND